MKIKKLSEAYLSKTPLRALIQCIPNFGGAIDTLLGSQGTKWQNERIDDFMSRTDSELTELKEKNLITEELFFERLQSDEAIAIIVRCIKETLSAIEIEKIELFRKITKNYLSGTSFSDISEVDEFIRTTQIISYKEFEYLNDISNGIRYVHIISSYGTYINPDKVYARPMKPVSWGQEDIEDDWKIPQTEIKALDRLSIAHLLEAVKSGPGRKRITGRNIISEFIYDEKINYVLSAYGREYI
jgi:hypothetical protein